jgi:pimeloyl-ACP methyl ester carboxylesterase
MPQRIAIALLGIAFLSACATPVGVRVAKPREVHRYLTQNVLSADEPSTYSEIELRRYGLHSLHEDDPDAALAQLHERALAAGLPPDALFALAELSFMRAESDHDPGRFAAAAHYAFAFLFPEEAREPLDPLDPRSRTAADLYNRAIASAFQRAPGGDVVWREGGVLEMPIGRFERVDGPPPDLGGYAIESFYPVAELEVLGMRNRYRRPGIGAPLAARLAPTPESETQPVELASSVQLPLTATLRLDEPLAQLRAGAFEGRVDLFPSLEVEKIDVGGRAVALEAEPTAALAAGLTESRFWRQELSAFLGNLLGMRGESGVFALRPYRSGRIPVVFVHGTASSPGRWANMLNDLIAGKRIRHRFAFWFFRYDSGNPIAYSAWQLRDRLQRAVERADPGGGDPCLRDMLVLGHSQGGLLTKLTSIDSGTAFWDTVSSTPLEETRFSDENKEFLRNVLFVEPLPFVRRVIFLATPHRGSYLAGPQFVRRLAQRLVRLPSDVVRMSADFAALAPNRRIAGERVPTSIDNMSPGNPFIGALAELPVVPDVTAHSIVAVDGDGPLEKESDGVVKYASAHVEGVESELVVRSPHSGMQDEAATIEEVRRVLLEHGESSRCPVPGVLR